MRRALLFGFAIAITLALAGCRAEEQQTRTDQAQPREQAATPSIDAARRPEGAQPGAQAPVSQPGTPSTIEVAGVATCHPGAELSTALSRLIEMADTNGDGQVSKDEAQSMTSFLVGGFFFRADGDGDGTITPEEGRRVREEFLNQYPALAAVFREARAMTGKSPFATIAGLLDIDYKNPLTLAEARAASRGAVNDLFGVADANRDSVITPAEVRAVSWDAARALGRFAFQETDNDRSGRLSLQEFQAALDAPAKAAFSMSDRDNDGQLTQEEAAAAIGQLARRLGLPLAMASK